MSFKNFDEMVLDAVIEQYDLYYAKNSGHPQGMHITIPLSPNNCNPVSDFENTIREELLNRLFQKYPGFTGVKIVFEHTGNAAARITVTFRDIQRRPTISMNA